MKIVPVASGKGGVGKSLVSANLSIALGKIGKSVLLADLDLGGSNLHLILGQRRVDRGLGHYFSNGGKLEDYIQPSDYKNVSFLPGDAEIPGIANIASSQKKKLMRALQSLSFDYLILDLGAGSTHHTLDFFLLSSHGIIVTTPTPTATVNAYLFLKNSVFRLMYNSFKRGSAALEALEEARKNSDGSILYLQDLLKAVHKADPEAYHGFLSKLQKFQPRLILNMLEDPKDADKAHRLRRSCQQYLNIDLDHLGVMYRDSLQDIALSSRLPIISYKPQSVLSQAVMRVADKLIQIDIESEDDLLSVAEIEESYETAEMEAELDFQSKVDYIEELLHTGTLSQGDLVETIRSQLIEIGHLRRENNLYKAKIVKAAQQGFSL